jgi:hypothetical protein
VKHGDATLPTFIEEWTQSARAGEALTKNFSQRLRSRDLLFGGWMSTSDPSVTEVMSQCGYDFLLFDGEHAPLPTQTLRYLLPITERRGAPAMYRPASHASPDIKAALDMGVDALLVPMVETVEQARRWWTSLNTHHWVAGASAPCARPTITRNSMLIWRQQTRLPALLSN